MKILSVILLLLLSSFAYAESFTKVTKISGLTTDGSYVRLVLDDMLEAEGCKNQNYYFIDATNESGKTMLQLLLAAKVNKQKVSIQIDGCREIEDRDYPIVTHVYLCDTEYCS